MSDKAWGGRFGSGPDQVLDAFSRSLPLDVRLLPYDLAGSAAHVAMLLRQGILPSQDGERILEGLLALSRQAEEGPLPLGEADEDVHLAVERLLTERIGEAALRMHAGRSRNDQVAVDLRLYVRALAHDTMDGLTRVMAALLSRAEAAFAAGILLPGYTHLQRAQPILLAHHLLAHWEALDRDRDRLADLARRANRSPLGAAALAGSSLPLDPKYTAQLLGFDDVCANSLDAVADRDFLAEFLSFAALTGIHLSRLAEEGILWTTAEFAFAELEDWAAFGSSLMPQKKNPEAFEHVRGRSGRLVCLWAGFMTTLKGLPLAYDSDLQESHYALYAAVDTLLPMLAATEKLLLALRFARVRMREAAADPLLLATDLADDLVRAGVPFRTAHRQVGELVGEAVRRGVPLSSLDPDTVAAHAPSLPLRRLSELSPEAAVAARLGPGGTAPERVRQALEAAQLRLAPPPLPPRPPSVAEVLQTRMALVRASR
jgi:argininosuccinate lyase